MTDFNLRAVVRDVLAGTSEADPGMIAGQVLARVDLADYPAALSQTMRLFVRQVISEDRNSTLDQPRPITSAPSARPGASWKGEGIRDGWQRMLSQRIEGADGWVQIQAASYEDLIHAAKFREQQAQRNNARARLYRNIATAVLDADVATVGELSAATQMRVLSGAA